MARVKFSPRVAVIVFAAMAGVSLAAQPFLLHLPIGETDLQAPNDNLSQAGAWRHLKPNAKSSAEWTAYKSEADSIIQRWRLGLPFLREHSAGLASHRFGRTRYGYYSLKSPKDVYLLARLTVAFPNDFQSPRFPNDLYGALNMTAGSSDPEFLRACYLADAVRDANEIPCSLGVNLMEVYPDDPELKHTFIRHVCHTYGAGGYYEMALDMFEKLYSSGELHAERPAFYRANLWLHMYQETKRKSNLDQAIHWHQEALTVSKTPYEKGISDKWLRDLEAFRRDKTYVDD